MPFTTLPTPQGQPLPKPLSIVAKLAGMLIGANDPQRQIPVPMTTIGPKAVGLEDRTGYLRKALADFIAEGRTASPATKPMFEEGVNAAHYGAQTAKGMAPTDRLESSIQALADWFARR